MDRRDLIRRALVASTFAYATLFGASCANAQALQAVHVRSFGMTSDTVTPVVGQAVHLTISAHVDEQVTELDNVTLPNLTGFDVQGDERRCMATSRGTDYVETVTMVPSAPGTVTIGSATLIAVDGTDGKPARFATNSLRFVIGGAPLSLGVSGGFVADLIGNMIRAFVVIALFVAGAWAMLRYLGRPRATPLPVAPAFVAPVAPVAPAEDFSAQYRKLVEAMRAEPTRPRALAVRHALRHALGAKEKETLADLVRRNAAGDRPNMLAALRAIERACFCSDAQVPHYARESLPFLTI